jgi:hypothetical protein
VRGKVPNILVSRFTERTLFPAETEASTAGRRQRAGSVTTMAAPAGALIAHSLRATTVGVAAIVAQREPQLHEPDARTVRQVCVAFGVDVPRFCCGSSTVTDLAVKLPYGMLHDDGDTIGSDAH